MKAKLCPVAINSGKELCARTLKTGVGMMGSAVRSIYCSLRIPSPATTGLINALTPSSGLHGFLHVLYINAWTHTHTRINK